MKHDRIMAICVAGGLVLHPGASAVTADSPGNPYSGIVERNVFALKPKPEAPPVVTTLELPPQKIVLQGILKVFGKKQVLWKTIMPAKSGEAAKEKSFMSSEGEREGEIEILEIDELAETIKVVNNGKPQSLSLEKDGMKPAGGPGVVAGFPLGAPGLPGIPGVPVVPMNTRIPAPVGGAVTPFGGGGAASVQRPLRVAPMTAGVPAHNVNPSAQQPMSAEEQVVMMEINRKLTAEKVRLGEWPPIPPTPITGQ